LFISTFNETIISQMDQPTQMRTSRNRRAYMAGFGCEIHRRVLSDLCYWRHQNT